jgi:NAD(P)-dependent dehydrogenase (short-subunit alcohol dehydrogenase family)
MNGLLEGRRAIVTGAGDPFGIAYAAAALMAEQGALIMVCDIDGEAAEAAARSLPGEHGRHFGARCNVTDKAACEAAVALALQRFGGRIDVLANMAGVTSPQRLMEVTAEMYTLVMDVAMRGTLYMTQAVVPAMRARKSGSIVNLSSVSAQRGGGVSGGSHYAAAMAAVLGYTKAAARELGPDNIRVNAVCPSWVESDANGNGAMTPERQQSIARSVPMGRLGRVDEVAGCVLFLAGDLASYVTGTAIDVNGGSHIH